MYKNHEEVLFMNKGIAEAYVLHPGDVEEKDGVIYLPLYMTGLL